jgi:predicted pyridoxine 5'-phosphate oxidase superfamily flavin-nucleotide-binding protein
LATGSSRQPACLAQQRSADMSYGFLDIAMTPSVKAVQTQMGADRVWADFKGERAFNRLTEDEAGFIADRDSFYMATVSETGWPYVQHRGGARGFLKVVDEQTLAFADFRGNRQYISTGNLAADDRACLFLMDYPRRARLKIYAHVDTLGLDEDPALTTLVTPTDYKAKLERVFRLRLEAFDWNCPQHITPRFTEREMAVAVRPLRERLARLEDENAQLRARLAARGDD